MTDVAQTAAPTHGSASSRSRHHWVVRVTHWVNVLALTVMVASGLRIFNAYPAFAPRGGTFCCYPFAGRPIPAWLTFGGWLAGARHWHFAMMWLLVANGLLYVGFVYLHGEWRELAPRRGDPRDAWEMVRFYLFVRREHPRQGKHNALQKLAYLALLVLAVVAVVSGLAIWKPVQLGWLTRLMGGYVWARYWHFLAMFGLVGLGLIHVFMVVSVDPWSIPAMITGRYRRDRSPERRNARPFYHLFGPGETARAGGASRGDAAVPTAEPSMTGVHEAAAGATDPGCDSAAGAPTGERTEPRPDSGGIDDESPPVARETPDARGEDGVEGP